MKLNRSSLLLVSLAFSSLSHAAAFQLYELGTPIVATAGVGQAAVASDASTVYFNPAGMNALPTTEIMLGSEMVLPYANFSADSANTISGNNGGNGGMLLPSVGGYFVYNYSLRLKMGFGVASPYAGALYYNNHWVGRYIVQQMGLITINVNPALAYQVNDWLSLGAGISVEYANLYQTVALPLTSTVDGQASVDTGSVSPGFNLGVFLIPRDTTKLGITYRSQIVHHLSGNVNFLNISDTPSVTTKLVMPANMIASISQQINPQFTLLGEAGWAHWSTMRNAVVTVDGFSAVTPENWHDTYRLGLAGQYQLPSPVLLQAGMSFDSSPTSRSHRTPNLPMDRQIRIGAGLQYFATKDATLSLSYEYMNMGNAPITNSSNLGILSGDYSRNYTNFFQASLNVRC